MSENIVYRYEDETGALIAEKIRKPNKSFYWRRPDPNKPGMHLYGISDVQIPLYQLQNLKEELRKNPERITFIVEGEKDVDNLLKIDVIATTNPNGGISWNDIDSKHFQDVSVVILIDKDKTGYLRGVKTAESLRGVARTVRLLLLPGLKNKGDVSDWLEKGNKKNEIQTCVKKALSIEDFKNKYEKKFLPQVEQIEKEVQVLGPEEPATSPLENDEIKIQFKAAIDSLDTNAGALFDKPEYMEYLKGLREYDPGEFHRLRKEIKDKKAFPICELDAGTRNPGEGEESVTDILIQIAERESVFFQDENRVPYAEFNRENDQVKEVWGVESPTYKQWLRSKYYDETQSAAPEISVTCAANTLGAKAIFKGQIYSVHMRCAKFDEGYIIDMGDERWRAIFVDKNGYKILAPSPVKFVRTPETLPLPAPIVGQGNLDLLWFHINIPMEYRELIVAFMLEAFRPDTPYIMTNLVGEQGAAKSTTQKCIRDLIDPNKVPLRGAPKNVEDVGVAAINNHLISYENLSGLPTEIQDMLCMMLTGGGIAKRKLYTDGQEYTVNVKRPVIANGISMVVTRPDLQDRGIQIDAPNVLDVNRKEQKSCDEDWARDKPMIFTGLLDLFAATLRKLPETKIECPPRMADFTRLGEAMCQCLGKPAGYFLNLYQKARDHANEVVLQGEPVALALEILLKDTKREELLTKILYYKLLKIIEENFPGMKFKFPESPRGLGNILRRIAPAFRRKGWNIEQSPRRSDGFYVVISQCAVSESTNVFSEHQIAEKTNSL